MMHQLKILASVDALCLEFEDKTKRETNRGTAPSYLHGTNVQLSCVFTRPINYDSLRLQAF